MINDITVVRQYDEDGEIYGEICYEIRDGNENYLADEMTLDAAIDTATELAEAHNVKFIKLQIATESI